MASTALIILDAQQDFLTFEGERSWNILKHLFHLCEQTDLVIATQSIHPPNHLSFTELGPHCVKGTPGARLNVEIKEEADYVPTKGDRERDDYSGFDARTLRPLESVQTILQAHKIKEVIVAGFGHGWDIPQTAYDANALKFKTRVWLPASIPIDEQTISSLTNAGVIVRGKR